MTEDGARTQFIWANIGQKEKKEKNDEEEIKFPFQLGIIVSWDNFCQEAIVRRFFSITQQCFCLVFGFLIFFLLCVFRPVARRRKHYLGLCDL